MDGGVMILVIYVDDIIIIIGSKAGAIAKIKSDLCSSFDITDLGLLNYFFSTEVQQIDKHLFVSQTKYSKSLLDRFNIADCKISSTPLEKPLKILANTNSKVVDESIYRQLQVVECVIYLTTTRPDLSYAVNISPDL